MKKAISVLLACALMTSMATACSGSQTASSQASSAAAAASSSEASSAAASESSATASSASGETVKMIYAVPGDAPKEVDRGTKNINEKLAADGVGIEIEFKYIPWDAWDQKLNIMLSTGEEFDAFHVMSDRVTLTNYASRNALADITDAMNQYGSNIKANVPESALKNCQIGGKQYGIPAYWVELALNHQATIRQDILTQNGLSMPKNFQELTEAYKKVMANWKGTSKPYFPSTATNDRIPYFFSTDKNFCIYDNLIYVNQDGTISDYYETDTFKEAAKNAKIWYDAGLINPDELTLSSDQVNTQLNSGSWFVMNGTVGNVSAIQSANPDFKASDIVWLDLLNGTPEIRPYGAKNLQAVPASSKHPESAVKFFNWAYSNQDNYNLFLYGTEGTDYKKGENNTYEPINDKDTGAPLFSFATWMCGNLHFSYLDANTAPDVNKHLYTQDTKATDGIAAAFTFDASSVQTKLADVQTVISSTLMPMAWGITDYDSNIKAAVEQLKKAGVDDVINAYKQQFSAQKSK